jgi:hypothetical protein
MNFLSASVASEIFQALPASPDGAVLKRDILGIGPSSPRLIPAVSASDFLSFMTSDAIPDQPSVDDVRHRLDELKPREIGTVARYYAANREALSAWKDIINDSIISLADKHSLASEYPTDMIADVLMAREELIDADLLPLVDNETLPRLVKDETQASVAHTVMNEILRRDMGALGDPIVSSRPELAFQSAVEALCEGRINGSWLNTIPSHAGMILAGPWLSHLQSSKELSAALAILRYPRDLGRSSTEIARRMSEVSDNAEGSLRTSMQAALLRRAIDEGSAQSWDLISIVLPELRDVVVSATLPGPAEAMLVSDLPHFYSAGYWDLNKRILLSLSKLYGVSPNNEVLHRLGLNQAEFELVVGGEERPKIPFAKLWLPWLP